MNYVSQYFGNNRIILTQVFSLALFVFFLLGLNIWIEKSVLIEETLFLVGVIFVSIGVIGRVWCFSYISGNKDKILIQTGPYSLCRNPLYFSNLMGALGMGLCTETFTIPLIIFSAFFAYYPIVIKQEEKKLSKLFTTEYKIYCKQVPRFFPSFSSFIEDEYRQIASKSFRRGITELLIFIIFIGLFDFIETLHTLGWITTFYKIY